MSKNESEIQPFYFKSFEQTIGVSRNLEELMAEFSRLSKENPDALEYHVRQRHIVQWLEHANEKDLAQKLDGVTSVDEVITVVGKHLESRQTKSEEQPVIRKMPERKNANPRKRTSKRA